MLRFYCFNSSGVSCADYFASVPSLFHLGCQLRVFGGNGFGVANGQLGKPRVFRVKLRFDVVPELSGFGLDLE
jgi:hypothetical protein